MGLVACPVRRQRNVLRLQRPWIAGHLGAERRVHEALDRRYAAIARRELNDAAATRRAPIPNVSVGADAAAAVSLACLLPAAADEELACLIFGEPRQHLGFYPTG